MKTNTQINKYIGCVHAIIIRGSSCLVLISFFLGIRKNIPTWYILKDTYCTSSRKGIRHSAAGKLPWGSVVTRRDTIYYRTFPCRKPMYRWLPPSQSTHFPLATAVSAAGLPLVIAPGGEFPCLTVNFVFYLSFVSVETTFPSTKFTVGIRPDSSYSICYRAFMI